MKNSKKNKILLILILAVLTILVLTSIKIAVIIPGKNEIEDGKGEYDIDITDKILEDDNDDNNIISVNTKRLYDNGDNYPYHLKSKYTFCMEESTRTGRYVEGGTEKFARFVQYRAVEKTSATPEKAYIFYWAMQNRENGYISENYEDDFQKAYWQLLKQLPGENEILNKARKYEDIVKKSKRKKIRCYNKRR